ncbi:MAG: AAA family ATPase, partial [Chitinispirillales bacterium]|nr:AAA family ATPase [Chitinispirillales bacterium]
MPVGIQDFPDIRERGFVYVDKTARAYELITGSGKAFFLSRPRRFGKSLLCSTLGAIFEGRRELFGEIAGHPALAMDSLDWDWKAHPVIRIDLNAGEYSKYGVAALYDTLSAEMLSAAKKYGVNLDRTVSPATQFKSLIEESG